MDNRVLITASLSGEISEVESQKKKVIDTVIQGLFIDKDKTKSN